MNHDLMRTQFSLIMKDESGQRRPAAGPASQTLAQQRAVAGRGASPAGLLRDSPPLTAAYYLSQCSLLSASWALVSEYNVIPSGYELWMPRRTHTVRVRRAKPTDGNCLLFKWVVTVYCNMADVLPVYTSLWYAVQFEAFETLSSWIMPC